MTRAFIVHVVIDDTTDLSFTAEDIQEELEASGYDVERVEVWQSPGAAAPQMFTPQPQGPQDIPPNPFV